MISRGAMHVYLDNDSVGCFDILVMFMLLTVYLTNKK